jgi:hypothetical protein
MLSVHRIHFGLLLMLKPVKSILNVQHCAVAFQVFNFYHFPLQTALVLAGRLQSVPNTWTIL